MGVKIKIDQQKLAEIKEITDRLDRMSKAFRDSHGNWHLPCGHNDEGAGAFGPHGISRPAVEWEVEYIHNSLAEGTLVLIPATEANEWDTVVMKW